MNTHDHTPNDIRIARRVEGSRRALRRLALTRLRQEQQERLRAALTGFRRDMMAELAKLD